MAMPKTSPSKRTSATAGKAETKGSGSGADHSTLTLHQKLLRLREGVQSLHRDQKGDTFKFTSIHALLAAVRPAMDELRIILKEEVIGSEVKQLPSGHFLVKVEMVFTWINVDHPNTQDEREAVRFEGLGIDDKGTERSMGIAQSYAEKMFLLKNLQIPLDDLDPDSKQPGVHTSSRKNETLAEVPPASEPPPTDFAFVDVMVKDCDTKEKWDDAYLFVTQSQQFAGLNAKQMDDAIEHFNRLYAAWESCK